MGGKGNQILLFFAVEGIDHIERAVNISALAAFFFKPVLDKLRPPLLMVGRGRDPAKGIQKLYKGFLVFLHIGFEAGRNRFVHGKLLLIVMIFYNGPEDRRQSSAKIF